MLSPNKIACFFVHQYLWNKTINLLDFLHKNSISESYSLFVPRHAETCLNMSGVDFDWSVGGMFKLKVIQN